MLAEIRRSIRGLFRSPGFAITAIATLALGIGANSAVFTVLSQVVLKPLPFPEPDRIVKIRGHNDLHGWTGGFVALPDVVDFRRQSAKLASIAGSSGGVWILTGRGPAVALPGTGVSQDFFSVLGIAPRIGRSFIADEYAAGRASAVILSDRAWKQHFNGDLRVLNSVVMLDGEQHLIVGVMPPEFQFPDTAEIWVPFGADKPIVSSRRFATSSAIGRLKPGVTLAEAQAEIAVIASRIAAEHADTHSGFSADVTTLAEDQTGDVRPVLQLFLGAAACVLLIACSNVANLMLARSTGRGRELAIRAALGASAPQLLRQTLAESLVLALTGGALGLVLAYAALRTLVLSNADLIPHAAAIHLDPPAVLFTFLIALATTALFSAFPALSILRTDAQTALGDRSGTLTAASNRARSGLVITQFALAAVLACSAGFLLRAFNKLIHTDPGYETRQILTADVTLTDRSYQVRMTKAYTFYRDALVAIGDLPGVEQAGLSSIAPLGPGGDYHIQVSRPGAILKVPATVVAASVGYHKAMGIPLRSGRYFAWGDWAGTRFPAIVSESLAKQLFGSRDPVGERIQVASSSLEMDVIGVVGDIRSGSFDEPPQAHLYTAIERSGTRFATFAIRSRLPASQLTEAVRAVIERIDPNVPLQNIRTMEEATDHSLAGPRLRTILLTLFAGAALLLAVIGIYGLLSFMVEQRYREIGVRMALGATNWSVARLVAGEGLRLAAIGIAAGIACAFVLGRVLGGLIYGIEPLDPQVASTAGALFVLVALAASLAPAIRAANADPQEILRHE